MTVTVESPFFAAQNVVTHISDGYAGMVKFREGHYAHDLRPGFLTDDDIFLSGFVDKEQNVTYESHDFWIRFDNRYGSRFDVKIIVHNGAGVQSLGVEYHIAVALKALVDAGQMIPAYHMCWGLFDMARRGAGNRRDGNQASLCERDAEKETPEQSLLCHHRGGE